LTGLGTPTWRPPKLGICEEGTARDEISIGGASANLAEARSQGQINHFRGYTSRITRDRRPTSRSTATPLQRLGITVPRATTPSMTHLDQRQASTIYVARNQYRVLIEVAPEYRATRRHPDMCVSKAGGAVAARRQANAAAGPVSAPPASTDARNSAAAAIAPMRCATSRSHRQGRCFDRLCRGEPAPKRRCRSAPSPAPPRRHPARRQLPGTVLASTMSFNLAPKAEGNVMPRASARRGCP
jgi:hypothetical protein